jgi:hypothetical protein
MSRHPTYSTVAVLIALMAAVVAGCARERRDRCAMCSKGRVATVGVTLVSDGGQETSVCCARCAVLYADRAATDGTTITHMQTRDYETGEPVELADAFFVYGSDTIPCCVPSVLVVSSRESAEDLAAHGGGTVMDFKGLRAALAPQTPGE